MNRTKAKKIGWADYTWNPVVGCTKGCDYCYARRQAKRFKKKCGLCYYFTPHLHLSRLNDPDLGRKKLARIFLGSMGELFDPDDRIITGTTHRVPARSAVTLVLQHVAGHPRHTFIILTKRPDRAKEYDFPPNVWLLTSIENQPTADERIPQLLECKASVLGVSYEPAHGPVDYENVDGDDHFFWDVLRGVAGPNTII